MSFGSHTDIRSSVRSSFTVPSTCSYSSHMGSVGATIKGLTRVARHCTIKSVFGANNCVLSGIIISSNFQIVCKLIIVHIIQPNMGIVHTSIYYRNRYSFTINTMILPNIIYSQCRHCLMHMGLSLSNIIQHNHTLPICNFFDNIPWHCGTDHVDVLSTECHFDSILLQPLNIIIGWVMVISDKYTGFPSIKETVTLL